LSSIGTEDNQAALARMERLEKQLGPARNPQAVQVFERLRTLFPACHEAMPTKMERLREELDNPEESEPPPQIR
jgi:hypothetical protein